MPAKPIKKIRPLQLIVIIFFTVSGGPYGLESLLSYAGQHGALLLLLVTPLLWDVPAILAVSELNSMMPIEGGYYQWVKNALGKRWGFYEGWWTWLYTFIDLAIYPVMFVQYAAFFFPDINNYKVPICLIIVWASAFINISGIVQVGRTALVLSAAVLGPFLVLFIIAITHHIFKTPLPSPSIKHIPFPSLGLALYTVMWNCLGWDSVTTYAGEVENPVKSYLISVFSAFILVIVVYFIVILIAQQSGINPDLLSDQRFPALGNFIGGHWLGALIAFGGMASSLGIYMAVLLSISRIPKVMADDNLLPRKLHELHPYFGTPYLSIIICSLVVSLLVILSFEELLVIDVTVYGAGLFLEYISLVWLRMREPQGYRPFKIPLNIPGLCILFLIPITVYAVALGGMFSSTGIALLPALFAVGILLTAELMWQIITRTKFIRPS